MGHSVAIITMARPPRGAAPWSRWISAGLTHAFSPWAMADLILLREWLTVRLPASITTTGLFAAGADASGKGQDAEPIKAPR